MTNWGAKASQSVWEVCVCEPIAVLPGNLYSRHIQIDGEVLAIQVQDTPGVQVSQMHPCRLSKQPRVGVCVCPLQHLVLLFLVTFCCLFQCRALGGGAGNLCLSHSCQTRWVGCLKFAGNEKKRLTVLGESFVRWRPVALEWLNYWSVLFPYIRNIRWKKNPTHFVQIWYTCGRKCHGYCPTKLIHLYNKKWSLLYWSCVH